MQDTLSCIKDNYADSLTNETNIADTASYQSIMFYQNGIRNNLSRSYGKNAFNFKYDSFKEKMKEPWIGDILKELFFR